MTPRRPTTPMFILFSGFNISGHLTPLYLRPGPKRCPEPAQSAFPRRPGERRPRERGKGTPPARLPGRRLAFGWPAEFLARTTPPPPREEPPGLAAPAPAGAAVPPPELGAALGPAVSGPDGASWPGPEPPASHLLLGEVGRARGASARAGGGALCVLLLVGDDARRRRRVRQRPAPSPLVRACGSPWGTPALPPSLLLCAPAPLEAAVEKGSKLSGPLPPASGEPAHLCLCFSARLPKSERARAAAGSPQLSPCSQPSSCLSAFFRALLDQQFLRAAAGLRCFSAICPTASNARHDAQQHFRVGHSLE